MKEAALVLDADGRAGLACVQSLGRLAEVHAAVRQRAAAGAVEASRWTHRVVLQPAAHEVEAAVAWLRAEDRRRGFDLVVPCTEASLRWLRALPEDDPLRRRAVLPGDAALDVALDKRRTLETAVGLGLPVPPGGTIRRGAAPPAPPGFPCVLKPVASKVEVGGRLLTLTAVVARDEAARRAALEAWLPHTDVLEQAWVPGRGIGVELLYDHGRCAWAFVHERLHEWPLSGGQSTLRRALPLDDALVAPSRRLLDALAWHGVAMVEWRREARGAARLMEVNPRLWGSLPLPIAAGVDFPRGLWALARGEAPGPQPRYASGLRVRHPVLDLAWMASNARANHADPLNLVQPIVPAALGWFAPLVGRERWDAFRRDDPAVGRGMALELLRAPFAGLAHRLARRRRLARARRDHARRWGAGAALPPVRRVLFVCLGNICRSPFAQVLGRARMPGLAVESAGFHEREGRPTPAHVVEAARSLGVDLAGWRSRRVTVADVAAADLVVAMDLENLAALDRAFPEARERTALLGLFDPAGPPEVEDPYALGPAAARAALARLAAALERLAARLAPDGGGPQGSR